jgi:Na+/H+ antiporter NhaA
VKDDVIEVIQELTKSVLLLGSVSFTFYFIDKVCFTHIPEENETHVNLILGSLLSMVLGKILVESVLNKVMRRKKQS